MFLKTDIEDFDIGHTGIHMSRSEFMVVIKGIYYEFMGVTDKIIVVAYGKQREKPIVEIVTVEPVVGSEKNMIDIILSLALRVINTMEEKHEIEPTLKYDEIKRSTMELLKSACSQYNTIIKIEEEDQYLQGLAMGKIYATIKIALETNILTDKEIDAIKAIYGI